MKKLLLIPVLALSLFAGHSVLTGDQAEARKGCCSRHGGVSGCQCADGTPLSAKCAPYYPQCSKSEAPKTNQGGGTKPAAKAANHNCQTLVAGAKGTWIFEKPDLKSKVLHKLKTGEKLVKTGEQPKEGPWLRVQGVGTKAIGYAHKTVCGCP